MKANARGYEPSDEELVVAPSLLEVPGNTHTCQERASQGTAQSRSRSSGARNVATMSWTESWTSLVSWKHSAADRHSAGPNCCAVATTALAKPGSSAASPGSSGQPIPSAAVPRLVI